MVELAQRLPLSFLDLFGTGTQVLRIPGGEGCKRIVALGTTDTAVRLAGDLPACMVILLQNPAARLTRSEESKPPSNLEILYCGLGGAQFLPDSITGVVSLNPDESLWRNAENLKTIAGWLEPQGVLCVNGNMNERRRWWHSRRKSSKAEMESVARTCGLLADTNISIPGMSVFRKKQAPVIRSEERHGTVVR